MNLRTVLSGIATACVMACAPVDGDGNTQFTDQSSHDDVSNAAPDATPDGSAAADAAGDAADPGMCTGPVDRDVLDSMAAAELERHLRECILPLAMAGMGPGTEGFVERAASCLQEATGITGGCAACYAASADCSFGGCGRTCLPSPTAPDCMACRCGHTGFDDCVTPLVQCSGRIEQYVCAAIGH